MTGHFTMPTVLARSDLGSKARWALVVLATAGCAGTYESSVRSDLARAPRTFGSAGQGGAAEPRQLGPGLGAYLAYAAERSPGLRASYERWRASVHRISRARQLPDPMVEFGVFVWSSGEDPGVVPGRIGVRQELP
jgi:outer membrane protein, heavy metal efflux system